ncbi:MAG: DUF6265 family protein [Anaerolineales bacterium]|jgi:hypothetical protein
MTQSHDIERLDWLSGTWSGEGFGGECQEIWSPPTGGVMMGMFRLFRNKQLAFYEFMVIEPQDSTLTLRIKHFDPGLIGWESRTESHEFPLLDLADQSITFDGIVYSLNDKGELVVDLKTGELSSNQVQRVVFTRISGS